MTTVTTSRQTVFALLADGYHAERTLLAIRDSGFNPDNISLLSPKNTAGVPDVKTINATKAPEGSVAGAATLGVLGGLGGFLVGVGALAIPGVGPFVAAGPIMAALSGVAIGAAVGGVAGALVGLGVPEYEAKSYDASIRTGKTLVAIHCVDSTQAAEVRHVLYRAGATDISTVNDR